MSKRDMKAEHDEINELQEKKILGPWQSVVEDKNARVVVGWGYPILVEMEGYESLMHLGKVEPMHTTLPSGKMQFGLVREFVTPFELEQKFGAPSDVQFGPRGGFQQVTYGTGPSVTVFTHWSTQPKQQQLYVFVDPDNWVYCSEFGAMLVLQQKDFSELKALKSSVLKSTQGVFVVEVHMVSKREMLSNFPRTHLVSLSVACETPLTSPALTAAVAALKKLLT
jgi:hypothetical protein